MIRSLKLDGSVEKNKLPENDSYDIVPPYHYSRGVDFSHRIRKII